ncbi:Putative serine protease HtrA [Rickettsiales bacterium Ac37b]|nr:Putative serine protease HtrA [Rickettsiales bacterium Ac37b]
MYRFIVNKFIFFMMLFLSNMAIASEVCHDLSSCQKLFLVGNKEAAYKLAIMYDLGKNVPADSQEAFKYYEKAASYGHKVAQYRMGEYYRLGNLVSRDFNQAAKWYKLSADQEHSMAKAMLWKMTKLKQISEQNLAKSVMGSGFIINSNYIITNNHVASECTSLTIDTKQDSFRATLVTSDPFQDLALLKSEKTLLSYLPLSESRKLKQWDELKVWGFDGKTGVLSSRAAKLVHPNKELSEKIGRIRKIVSKLILTKAVSPGFSGGPVINNFGKVVGVNSAGISYVIENTGYDLAIPLKSLKYFLEENKVNYYTNQTNISDINNAIVKISCLR